jgi:hypothetical protein
MFKGLWLATLPTLSDLKIVLKLTK